MCKVTVPEEEDSAGSSTSLTCMTDGHSRMHEEVVPDGKGPIEHLLYQGGHLPYEKMPVVDKLRHGLCLEQWSRVK